MDEEVEKSVFPEWEPIPWNAAEDVARSQHEGFTQRAAKPLLWIKIDIQNFPTAGVLGHDREWFIKYDIAYFTNNENEDLIIIDNPWHGFPDPPRWGLASRPSGTTGAWQMWGHFPELPPAWIVPDAEK